MITIGRILFILVQILLAFTIYTSYKYTIVKYQWSLIHSIVFYIIMPTLMGLSLSNYYQAVFTQAGPIKIITPPHPKLCEQLDKRCNKCNNNWKPPRAHHCKSCNKCVFRMDHHCEWINNCVGSHNQKFFILFLIYAFLLSATILYINALGIYCWITIQKRAILIQVFALTYSKVAVAATLFFSVFFLIFTAQFLHSQIYVIIDNQTTVESHKEVFGKPGSFMHNMSHVFGNQIITWPFPIKCPLNMNYLELMYDPLYVRKSNIFLEDQFTDKSGQFYDYFNQYKVI